VIRKERIPVVPLPSGEFPLRTFTTYLAYMRGNEEEHKHFWNLSIMIWAFQRKSNQQHKDN